MCPAVGIHSYRSRGGNEEISHTRHATERRGLAVPGYDHTELHTTCFYGTCEFPLQDPQAASSAVTSILRTRI